MKLYYILCLILHLSAGESISSALDSARIAYAERGETTTLYLSPGNYEEELTIDVPGLRLINAAARPSIGLRNCGVDIDSTAVRITWYYGHGYQYASMGERFNYGGKRSRLWNASVLVDATDFYAEGIIFENAFNQYVCAKEAEDSLVDISQAKTDWSEKERPKRRMPMRPKQVGSTVVQQKKYIERAAAISFTSRATHAVLKDCRCVGHQDVLYGDQGASVYIDGGILQGGVDFIFGGLMLAADRATIVVNVSDAPNDQCYISASRNDPDGSHETADKYGNPAPTPNPRGMLFYRCHIRFATTDELARPGSTPAYLARPWRWWGETVWAYTTWDEGCVCPEGWHTGLTKGVACPYSYEYQSQDQSKGRPDWVQVLTAPVLPDGTAIVPQNWQ